MKPGCIDHIRHLTVPPLFGRRGNWVFLRNAKVATTSICEGPLRKYSGFDLRRITDARQRLFWEFAWKHVVTPRLDEAFIFTFVRNPWDRVLSAFLHCRNKAQTLIHQIDSAWEFGAYVKEVLAEEGPRVNYHFTPQYDTLCFGGEGIPGLFVGRFERLLRDWRKVARRIRVSAKLPKLNARNERAPYQAYYDRETRDIVGRLYRPEIELLGYEF